jgi:hypothetical protein
VDVAAGFSTHSGWAVAVTAGLDEAGRLRVVDRRRVELIDDDVPRQAYHAAAGLPAAEARALVARVDTSIAARSREVLTNLSASSGDCSVVAAAVVGEPREIPDVDVVLASHARMHACEGEQYRRGLADAADELGLRVVRAAPGDLASRAGELLAWPAERIEDELAAVRKSLGPPWQKDHKEATLAALVALRLPRSG